jgi:hypothetical protein
MPFLNTHDSKTNLVLILFIALSMNLTLSCSQRHTSVPEKNVSTGHEKTDFGLCIDVYGRVLGNITPGSNAFLFELNQTDYETVMNTVRMNIPIQIGIVNESAGFNLTCLDVGNYVVSIPAESYRYESVGSPLPYDFSNENVSLEIYFQGGDTKYLVGTFGIKKTNKTSS